MILNALPFLFMLAIDRPSLQEATRGNASINIQRSAIASKDAFDAVDDKRSLIIQREEDGVAVELRLVQYE